MRKMEHRRNQVAGTCNEALNVTTHARLENVRNIKLLEDKSFMQVVPHGQELWSPRRYHHYLLMKLSRLEMD